MVNELLSPAAWASRRRMRTQALWKVATHMLRATGPTSSPTRSLISAAALLVKVMARISPGLAGAQQVRDPSGEHTSLARAGARDDQQGAAAMLDRLALGRVQPLGQLCNPRHGGAGGRSPAPAHRAPLSRVRELSEIRRWLGHDPVLRRWCRVERRLLTVGRFVLAVGRLVVHRGALGQRRLLGAVTLLVTVRRRSGRGHRHSVQTAEGIGQREVVEE